MKKTQTKITATIMKMEFLIAIITRNKFTRMAAIVMLLSSFLGYAELPIRWIDKRAKQRALPEEQAAAERRWQVEADGEDLAVIEAARLRAAQAELEVARVRYRLAAWMAAARAAAQQRKDARSYKEHIAADLEEPTREIQENEAAVEAKKDLASRI